AVELVDPNATGSAYYDNAVALGTRVIARCVANGQLPRRLNNTLCLAPPLISSEEQLTRLVDVLGEAIRAESQAG
ncbi:MAG: aspartate aminotransferase family protein, partial [Chloroflexi bacterium]|nr:aspartate aminotransferase family protein [Chloroflexota bacterium]